MGRSLRYLGVFLLAATVWLLIAGAADWMSQHLADRLARTTAMAGIVAMGAGVLLGVVARVAGPRGRGRCQRCGAPTERGQAYCLDHLLKTVDEYRDQHRDRFYDAGPSGR
jgi:hypothetical protein